MKYWNNEKVKAFKDVDGTIFIKGPYEFGDKSYEYKLIDNMGVDYCTREQMEWWDVELKQVIDNEHYLKTVQDRAERVS